MGFVDTTHPIAICLLEKSLYGLRQAPHAWFDRFTAFVLQLGFTAMHSDSSMVTLCRSNDIIYLLLYVEDIILTGSSLTLLQHVINRLRAKFAIKDMGELWFFLSIDVKHTRGRF